MIEFSLYLVWHYLSRELLLSFIKTNNYIRKSVENDVIFQPEVKFYWVLK